MPRAIFDERVNLFGGEHVNRVIQKRGKSRERINEAVRAHQQSAGDPPKTSNESTGILVSYRGHAKRRLALRKRPHDAKPVRELLRLVHIEGIALERARGEDFEVVSYLKKANPKLYTSLRKAATGRTPATGSSRTAKKR